ncbi:hypothetical protein SAMN05446927_4294 [Caballeronia arationis]|uniref:Uncharacterized protein n=1 Tax=Caballeronia arationis TaxID=1777142 RepID=A0A7Z7N3J2_9BURK|nr:hypothetical protein SAMN05446927_4294 [Caballeronia arationis]
MTRTCSTDECFSSSVAEARYPSILVAADRLGSEGAASDFFECGDGWFDIIDVLCQRLEFWIVQNEAPPLVIERVKAKFGRLVIQYAGGNDMTAGMVDMAQEVSARVCEVCGNPGRTEASTGRWLITRCADHRGISFSY